jgi:glycosyltransferase involved in cell wall biosynthesis
MRKNLCFIVSSALTAKAFLANHIEALSKNYNIYLVGNFDESDIDNLKHLKLVEIKIIPIKRGINLYFDFLSLSKLYIYFCQKKFDFIHSVTPKAGLLSMVSGKLSRIPIRIHIFTGQVWYTQKGVYRYMLKLIDKLIVYCSTQILVDGYGQRNFLLSQSIINETNSLVLAKGSINGVDTEIFRDISERQKKTQRRHLSIPNDKIIILFLGRLNKEKGVMDLSFAFSQLQFDFKNSLLLFVGYDEENLVNQIKNLISPDQFMFCGPTQNPEEFYQIADIFCLPSYREGFGTSVLEASASRLPIVCSNTYGLEDSVINEVTGLKADVGSISQIQFCLTKLLEDPKLREELGRNGRDFVISNFKSEFVTLAWLQFYENIY